MIAGIGIIEVVLSAKLFLTCDEFYSSFLFIPDFQSFKCFSIFNFWGGFSQSFYGDWVAPTYMGSQLPSSNELSVIFKKKNFQKRNATKI